MVFLKDLKTQWPWSSTQPPSKEELADKEIYTHRIAMEDACEVWRVPILDPLGGFAFTGFRVSVFGKESTYTVTPRLVLGQTEKTMFGLPWDKCIATNGSWTALGFPLTNKIIAITEDGLDLLIYHEDPCWGQVEFVAQRFDDLLEDEKDIAYIFLNHRTDKAEWILNAENRMYKPIPIDMPLYNRKAKLLPSVGRLLDNVRNTWEDTELFWNQVNLPAPLLQ
jgi:hypothetical protein